MDIVDSISQGHTYQCPYSDCDSEFSDIDPGVALAIRNGHIRRKHALEEE